MVKLKESGNEAQKFVSPDLIWLLLLWLSVLVVSRSPVPSVSVSPCGKWK